MYKDNLSKKQNTIAVQGRAYTAPHPQHPKVKIKKHESEKKE